MDFIIGLSRTSRQYDSIMIAVDRLAMVVHFILVKSIYLANDIEYVFM